MIIVEVLTMVTQWALETMPLTAMIIENGIVKEKLAVVVNARDQQF